MISPSEYEDSKKLRRNCIFKSKFGKKKNLKDTYPIKSNCTGLT